jgi:hypothetical protein
VNFFWNVRFDHGELAQQLLKQGIPLTRCWTTYTLSLVEDYETIFARFDRTARNLVHRTRREGVNVRISYDPSDVAAFYELYIRFASRKGFITRPKALFDELLKLRDDVVFGVLELSNRVIGGGWLFRDGETVLYKYVATDYDYTRHSPDYALMDYAIRLGHEEGRSLLNFGSTDGIASLEQFKARWGAKPQNCWSFSWQNPMWETLQKRKEHLAPPCPKRTVRGRFESIFFKASANARNSGPSLIPKSSTSRDSSSASSMFCSRLASSTFSSYRATNSSYRATKLGFGPPSLGSAFWRAEPGLLRHHPAVTPAGNPSTALLA